ncbi:MAG: hypothetical protein GY759_03980 [Chloroflexi bacterium]|nr:hypothetical protein [Chloroflexota bacterium]
MSGSIPDFANLPNLLELTLSDNQLSGSIPGFTNLPNLYLLYLHSNLLSGPLPQSLTHLNLNTFGFQETELCEPTDEDFQAWLDGIPDLRRTGISCDNACSGVDWEKQPVLLVHGWDATDHDLLSEDIQGFEKLKQWMLIDDDDPSTFEYGYKEGCNLFYATDVKAKNSKDENAEAIQKNLQRAYNDVFQLTLNPNWQGEFDIIGHSYGGLNARYYLEGERYKYDNSHGIHVNNLFTLGSPHGGVIFPSEVFPAAIVISFGKVLNSKKRLSGHELLEHQMSEYNDDSDQPEGTCYRLIGGDFLQQPDLEEDSPTVQKVYSSWPFAGKPNDIGVTVRSSLNLGGSDYSAQYPNVATYLTTDMHGYTDLLGLGNVDSYVYPAETYVDHIKDNLGKGIEECHETGQSYVAQDDVTSVTEATEAQPILITETTVSQSLPVIDTAVIDWSGQSVFYADSIQGDIDLILTDPDGLEINPTSADTDPNVTYAKSTDGTTTFITYVIDVTKTGTWTYTVTSDSTEPVPFELFVAPDSPLVLVAEAPAQQPLGTSIAISASITHSTNPVTGASVQVQITRPDSSEDILALLDDGVAPDITADDGIYTGEYLNTTLSGHYFTLTEATGTYDSLLFRRTAQTTFSVIPGNAQLNNTYLDRPIDVDGDGLYEYIELDVGVDVTQAGDFTVAASLVGSGSEHIDLANASFSAEVGSTTITLRFSGAAIRSNSIDGPYTISDVSLVDDQTVIEMDAAVDVWQTSAYDHTHFDTSLRPDNPVVTIGGSPGNVQLQWPHLSEHIDSYEVFRSTKLEFNPEDYGWTTEKTVVDPPAPGPDITHTDSEGTPDTNYFYYVRSITSDQRSSLSNGVGIFNFSLVPGTDPLDAFGDADGDGLDDGFEVDNGLDPLDPNG